MNDRIDRPDLSALERKPRIERPRRRLLPWVLPVVILVSFLAIVGWSLRDVLLERAAVTVVRPRAVEPSREARGVAVALQAAGWVEPDPFPRLVAPRTAGVVEEVRVQESDAVAAGDVVARLVDEDARLELEEADAAVAVAAAAVERARTDVAFEREEFAQAIPLEERVAVAAATLVGRRDEATLHAAAAARADAEVRLAEEELRVEEHLAREGAAGPRQLEVARARLEAALAARETAKARAARATADVAAAAAADKAARRTEELRIEDRHALEAAERELAHAEAALARAEAARRLATLRLERVDVRTPWSGIVLERTALPGSVLAAGEPVCEVFDPERLRVRVDVPFEDVGRTFVGQRAEIECEARRGAPYAGTVLRRVQRADIQKVTLEVQVRIDDPDGKILPDMLCQVRFLGREEGAGPVESPPTTWSVLVPTRLVDGGQVWVLGPEGDRARRRDVSVGEARDGWTEIRDGLNPTDKLIDEGRDGLEDGDRVRVRARTRKEGDDR